MLHFLPQINSEHIMFLHFHMFIMKQPIFNDKYNIDRLWVIMLLKLKQGGITYFTVTI